MYVVDLRWELCSVVPEPSILLQQLQRFISVKRWLQTVIRTQQTHHEQTQHNRGIQSTDCPLRPKCTSPSPSACGGKSHRERRREMKNRKEEETDAHETKALLLLLPHSLSPSLPLSPSLSPSLRNLSNPERNPHLTQISSA